MEQVEEPKIETEDEGALECGYGKCVREHPLHCCHTAVTAHEPSGQKGMELVGWRCVFCGKESRTWTLVRIVRTRSAL